MAEEPNGFRGYCLKRYDLIYTEMDQPVTPEICSYSIPIECRYLLRPGTSHPPVVALALHGYGSSAEAMLSLTAGMLGGGVSVAALQAPNQQYGELSPTPDSKIGYNWGTSRHGDWNILVHHRMVSRVLNDLRTRFGIPASRCLLVGFSQAVGLNYRFAGTYPEQVGGVIGICGGVPRNWDEEEAYRTVAAPILHLSRSEDEIFPPATTQSYAERLRKHALDVEFHLLPGGHRFPSRTAGIVEPWLERVFGLRISA